MKMPLKILERYLWAKAEKYYKCCSGVSVFNPLMHDVPKWSDTI